MVGQRTRIVGQRTGARAAWDYDLKIALVLRRLRTGHHSRRQRHGRPPDSAARIARPGAR